MKKFVEDRIDENAKLKRRVMSIKRQKKKGPKKEKRRKKRKKPQTTEMTMTMTMLMHNNYSNRNMIRMIKIMFHRIK